MGTRHESEPRATTEVDPKTLRELLAKQERLASGSEQMAPQPRATVAMSKDELLGLREACADDAKPGRTTNLGIQPIQWRRPATVVRTRPSTLVIVVALACAGMLSLALALLAFH
jgi:hypothetical protein